MRFERGPHEACERMLTSIRIPTDPPQSKIRRSAISRIAEILDDAYEQD